MKTEDNTQSKDLLTAPRKLTADQSNDSGAWPWHNPQGPAGPPGNTGRGHHSQNKSTLNSANKLISSNGHCQNKMPAVGGRHS